MATGIVSAANRAGYAAMDDALSQGVGSATMEEPAGETRYDHDFYGWTQRQAELLRRERFAEADLANIIAEIESLGRSEAAALESAYRLICTHQLKRILQPERAGSRSWTSTIVRERLHAARILRDNPGLKPRCAALFADAYADARREAAAETRRPLVDVPVEPPFTLAQITDEDFWAVP